MFVTKPGIHGSHRDTDLATYILLLLRWLNETSAYTYEQITGMVFSMSKSTQMGEFTMNGIPYKKAYILITSADKNRQPIYTTIAVEYPLAHPNAAEVFLPTDGSLDIDSNLEAFVADVFKTHQNKVWIFHKFCTSINTEYTQALPRLSLPYAVKVAELTETRRTAESNKPRDRLYWRELAKAEVRMRIRHIIWMRSRLDNM